MKKGQIIGYMRVSSDDQNLARQLEGIKIDKMFIDKVSGKSLQREGLNALLHYIREGDTMIVHSMDRLARNFDDLRSLVTKLTHNGITLKFIKEGLTFTGDDSSISKLLLSVMGAVAEFERAHIRERQLEGIKLAKQKGLYKGRKAKLNPEQIATLCQQLKAGVYKSQIARDLNISRATLYKYYKNHKQQGNI